MQSLWAPHLPMWQSSGRPRTSRFMLPKEWPWAPAPPSDEWYHLENNQTAHIPATKEPVSLIQRDGKRPYGTTLLPWARGKPMTWDVTVPGTYAESHIDQTARKACPSLNKASANKIVKTSMARCLPITSFCQWQLKLPATGTNSL